ncbi:MAG TPA: hypothetical protein VGM30_23570 [Puia sp.]
MERESPKGLNESEALVLGFEPSKRPFLLLINIIFFASAIKAYSDAVTAASRKQEVQRILAATDWFVHYQDKKTGRRVLSESICIQYDHEKRTAICLARMNYDVVFAPDGMFHRSQKKFDVYLLRDTIILEADLKCVSSTRPDTIANRIIGGGNQARRIILDIRSTIRAKDLIDGLRSGTGKNNLIKEILLFYRNKFYILPKSLIWSKKIFDILKSEKGYT